MPALSSSTKNEKILVTGASGFIAAWLVRNLLEKGYTVRGTVRSESKGQYLSKIFAGYGNRFEYVIVKDIAEASFNFVFFSIYGWIVLKEGAFDEAVKGVTAIEHTASPVTLNIDDPQGESSKPDAANRINFCQN